MENRFAIHRAVSGLALLLAAIFAPRAEALTLRAPQIVFQSGTLQAYLDGVGESVDVLTDQIENASILPPATVCDFVLTLSATTGTFTVGTYSTSQASPTLCPLLPSGAGPGWTCLCHVSPGGILHAALEDEAGSLISLTSYSGFDPTHAMLYIQGPGGTWYAEDTRNGGGPQALSLEGTGVYFTDVPTVFLCFEGSPYDPAASTFTSEVVLLQPRCGDPAHTPTWGQLKARYR